MRPRRSLSRPFIYLEYSDDTLWTFRAPGAQEHRTHPKARLTKSNTPLRANIDAGILRDAPLGTAHPQSLFLRCLSLRRIFFLLCVLIFLLFLFLPQGMTTPLKTNLRDQLIQRIFDDSRG